MRPQVREKGRVRQKTYTSTQVHIHRVTIYRVPYYAAKWECIAGKSDDRNDEDDR